MNFPLIKKRVAVLPLTRSLSFVYNYYLDILFGEELLFTMESMIRQFFCGQKSLLSLVKEVCSLNPGQKIHSNRTQIIKKIFR